MIVVNPFEKFESKDETSIVFHCPGCNFPHSFRTRGLVKQPVWEWNGKLDKATFSPSLIVKFGDSPNDKRCHSFVKDGQIQFLDDCTHELVGQTITIEPFEVVG